MPSVCIHVRKAYTESEETAIMNAVHAWLVTAFGVKAEDTNIMLMAHRSHRFMCPIKLRHRGLTTATGKINLMRCWRAIVARTRRSTSTPRVPHAGAMNRHLQFVRSTNRGHRLEERQVVYRYAGRPLAMAGWALGAAMAGGVLAAITYMASQPQFPFLRGGPFGVEFYGFIAAVIVVMAMGLGLLAINAVVSKRRLVLTARRTSSRQCRLSFG